MKKEEERGGLLEEIIMITELKVGQTILSSKGKITEITRSNNTYTSIIMTCRCSLSICKDTTGAFSTRCAGCRRNW